MDAETELTQDGTEQNSMPVEAKPNPEEVAAKTTAFINQWVKRIKAAKKKYEEGAFKKMDECMQLAKDGAAKEWLSGDKYVVAIINRYINQSVSQLYAKNPKAYASRKKRRMFKVWDGQLASLNEAKSLLQESVQMTGMPDPNATAILQDAEQVKQYDILMDGVADTLTILHNHFLTDQSAQYKQQFKALVRRTKVCGVGYVKLGFQRMLEQDPDVTVKLEDATQKLDTMRRLMAEAARDEGDEDSPDMEQLRTLIADLTSQEYLIVQEGPVLSFPRSKSIIVDPACVHLKTLAGANWTAEEFEKTPDEIEEIYKKNVKDSYSQYKGEDAGWSDLTKFLVGEEAHKTAKVWRVMNRKTGQEFTICEGYKDYLKPPAPPEVKLRRFFDIFPLVFNEIEDEKELIPPSDVWHARHIQSEYNRARQGLREHRMQNRPAYLAAMGSFEETDKDKLQSHASGEIIFLNGLIENQRIADKLQAKPVMQIDPKQYEVESIWNDLLRATGSQQANLGPTSGATATEASIAEHSRTDTVSEGRDDVDDLLSALAQATGELLLREVAKDTVIKIVGPGAVWPEAQESREEIAEEITLDVRAGSSGRPNQAADLAKMERAMPFVIQLPNVNPVPWTQKYLDLLEVEAEDAIIEGLPSITAVNAAMSSAAKQASTGNPQNDPGAQGDKGGQNAPAAAQQQPGPQPAFPAPAAGP